MNDRMVAFLTEQFGLRVDRPEGWARAWLLCGDDIGGVQVGTFRWPPDLPDPSVAVGLRRLWENWCEAHPEPD